MTRKSIPDFVPSQLGEYSITLRGCDLDWGTLSITCHNHPKFSNRLQDLTIALKGGGSKRTPNDIDVDYWITLDEWVLSDDDLIEHLKTVLT